MKRGIVVGEVWATRRAPGLHGRSLKLVVEYAEPDPPTAAALAFAPLVVAVDTLEAHAGQPVLLAYGSGARNVLTPGPANRHELCDAAVAMLPESEPDPEPNSESQHVLAPAEPPTPSPRA